MATIETSIRPRPPALGQLAAARRLPDNSAPDWPALHLSVPAREYLDPARYDQEWKHLFRKLPLALAPSILVKPGSHVCRNGYGVPIILTRDRQGAVHAHVNACKHRGSRLVDSETPERANLMVCPYHAWSYDLTGRLVAIPRAETFADINKADYGLTSLPCEEHGGLIWVRLDRHAPADFSHLDAGLVEELAALGMEDMHLFAHRRHRVAANWKLIMDTFLEGYHVTRLHATTLGPVSEDVTVDVGRLGSHLRQTSGRINFRRQMVEDAAHAIEQLRRVVVFVYTLVPNAVLICSTDFTNLLVFEPQGVGETIVQNFMLTNTEPMTEKLQTKWERHLERTDGQAFPEDFSASAASQIGLGTGVVEALTLGGMEQAVALYHGILNDLLAEAPYAAG